MGKLQKNQLNNNRKESNNKDSKHSRFYQQDLTIGQKITGQS